MTVELDNDGFWSEAVERFVAGDFKASLQKFCKCDSQSRIMYNIALVSYILGQTSSCILHVRQALQKDPFLAIANYLHGVVLYELQSYEAAYSCFSKAAENFRGTEEINYGALGLEVELRKADILYNQGLCFLQLDAFHLARECFLSAQSLLTSERATLSPKYDSPRHWRNRQHNDRRIESMCAQSFPSGKYLLIKSPLESVFAARQGCHSPNEEFDFLGKPKLVVTVNKEDKFVGFSGNKLKRTISPASSPLISETSFFGSIKASNKRLLASQKRVVTPISARDQRSVLPISVRDSSPSSPSSSISNTLRKLLKIKTSPAVSPSNSSFCTPVSTTPSEKGFSPSAIHDFSPFLTPKSLSCTSPSFSLCSTPLPRSDSINAGVGRSQSVKPKSLQRVPDKSDPSFPRPLQI